MLDKLWTAVSLMKRLYDTVMQPLCCFYGITRMELDVLLFLANNPDYDTAKDIIEKRKLTKSHVSAAVSDLVGRGFLEASFQEGNKKTIHLRLCAPSKEAVEKGQEAQLIFFKTLLTGFTPDEIRDTESRLDRISENVREALTGGGKDAV